MAATTTTRKGLVLLAVGLLAAAALEQLVSAAATTKEDDRVASLPGLEFRYEAKHYSGMLDVSNGASLHYWLLESQNAPDSDPLV